MVVRAGSEVRSELLPPRVQPSLPKLFTRSPCFLGLEQTSNAIISSSQLQTSGPQHNFRCNQKPGDGDETPTSDAIYSIATLRALHQVNTGSVNETPLGKRGELNTS